MLPPSHLDKPGRGLQEQTLRASLLVGNCKKRQRTQVNGTVTTLVPNPEALVNISFQIFGPSNSTQSRVHDVLSQNSAAQDEQNLISGVHLDALLETSIRWQTYCTIKRRNNYSVMRM